MEGDPPGDVSLSTGDKLSLPTAAPHRLQPPHSLRSRDCSDRNLSLGAEAFGVLSPRMDSPMRRYRSTGERSSTDSKRPNLQSPMESTRSMYLLRRAEELTPTHHGLAGTLSAVPPLDGMDFEIYTKIPPHDRITLGICALSKKAQSKPMQEIMKRLPKEEFNIIDFGDEMILDRPVEEWPLCDCLISFHSGNFPLEKAQQYVYLRKPLVLNELETQWIVLNRKAVYKKLQDLGIAVPRHGILDRSDGAGGSLEEHDNYVIVNGVKIDKPFVEKPLDAEDHNVYIYYPTSAGGGSKRLFRKVGDKSSDFYPDICHVRREGSYIYEEFLNTQGTDVKVYTVGKDYAHAEARKSPVLDGKVMRDVHGKEVRYPVILTAEEKEIARKIVLGFKQMVCGFDLLRVRGKSYVCDVNGWSFVKKNSKKYYDDCANILREHMLRHLAPQRLVYTRLMLHRQRTLEENHLARTSWKSDKDSSVSSPRQSSRDGHDSFKDAELSGMDVKNEELRCVIAVIRHGDRTPKQKLKMKVWHHEFLAFYRRHGSNDETEEVKMKAVSQLQELLNLTRKLVVEYRVSENRPGETEEWEKNGGDRLDKLYQMMCVLSRWKFQGINRKVQLKPLEWDVVSEIVEGAPVERKVAKKVLLICKWGGDLTQAGKKQAEELGHYFRKVLYPGDEEGLRRLHSTFRHDLKIYTSDEGRVQMTAAGFAKGFLELDGDLTPILVSLVTTLGKANNHSIASKVSYLLPLLTPSPPPAANKMLDHSGQTEARKEMESVKERLHNVLQLDQEVDEEMVRIAAPDGPISVIDSLEKLGNPRKALERLRELVGNMTSQIGALLEQERRGLLEAPVELYGKELLTFMFERWNKLMKDFYDKKRDKYDLSKIPDIYDCIKYDIIHNSTLKLAGAEEMYVLAQKFADCLVPQEYGLAVSEKQIIGYKVCQALLGKIEADLQHTVGNKKDSGPAPKKDSLKKASKDGDAEEEADHYVEHHGYQLDPVHAKELLINSPERQVRTRLYFTSESHMHTLLNSLRYPCPPGPGDLGISDICLRKHRLVEPEVLDVIEDTPEMCYLTHIVIRVFENLALPEDDEWRYRAQILFSPGAEFDHTQASQYEDDVVPVAPLFAIGSGTSARNLQDHLLACVKKVTEASKEGAEDAVDGVLLDSLVNLSMEELPADGKRSSIFIRNPNH